MPHQLAWDEQEFQFLDRLGSLVSQAVAAGLPGYHGCILSSRIAIEAAARLSVRLTAVACRVLAINEQLDNHIKRLNRIPDVRELCELDALDGAWAVGIGHRESEATVMRQTGGYDFHVIAAGHSCFVDCSSSQMSRPNKNLLIPSYLVGPYSAEKQCIEGHLPAGAHLLYELVRGEKGFYRSPDWNNRVLRNVMVQFVLQQMKR